MARNPIVASVLMASMLGAPMHAYAQDDTDPDQPPVVNQQVQQQQPPAQQPPPQPVQQPPAQQPQQPVNVQVDQKDDDDDMRPASAPVYTRPAPTAAEGETVSEYGGPSRGMLWTGVGVFGVSYAAAAIAGSASSHDGDRNLLVPIAGPWMALADRPKCDVDSDSCDKETGNKVLIITDGVFQAVGTALIIGAFLSPRKVTRSRARTAKTPTIQVAPVTHRTGGGIAAFGTF